MKRIHGLGVRKILVPSLPPLGCLPQSTSKLSFQQCNETENSLSGFHNLLLQQAVAKLNNETQDSAFVILDLFGAFMTTFKNKGIVIISSRLRIAMLSILLFIYFYYYCKQVGYNNLLIISYACRKLEDWESVEAMLCWDRERFQLWKCRWQWS